MLFYFIEKCIFNVSGCCSSRLLLSSAGVDSTRLFGSYLEGPYTFHLQHNSGKLLSNTITESMQFAIGFTALHFSDLMISLIK